MKWIDTDRGCFAARAVGGADRSLVIALHGFPDDASTFDDLADHLVDAGFAVVAPYLRGYSPSPLAGDLSLPGLVDDLFAQLDVLAPDRPVGLIGHDYGAQIGYAALSRDGARFSAAALLAGAHPTLTMRNAKRHARQWWMSRYIVFFQLPRLPERIVARDDFAYVEKLWRRWAPHFVVPPDHLDRVKATLRASMPAPIAMYRAGGFDIGMETISTPTLFIHGRDDGCLLPELADGQDALFTGDYDEQTWDGVGHFPHLERPELAATAIAGWLARHGGLRQ